MNNRQSGFIMVVALVMLVVLTMLALASISMTNISTKVAFNTQLRGEAGAATQQVIEQVVSNIANFTAPLPPTTTVTVDINNDGTPDYTVDAATPVCVASTPIKVSQLDSSNPNDVPCFGSSALANSGIVGGAGATGNSLCANTTWDVQASTNPATNSGLSVVTHQGVNLRVVTGTTC